MPNLMRRRMFLKCLLGLVATPLVKVLPDVQTMPVPVASPVQYLITYSFELRKEQWIALDCTVLRASRQRMRCHVDRLVSEAITQEVKV